MFELKNFIKMGLLDAVGKKPVYWIVNNAAGWLDKGVLDEADLAEISAAIEAQNPVESNETEVSENV
jgi:hypothetical protein